MGILTRIATLCACLTIACAQAAWAQPAWAQPAWAQPAGAQPAGAQPAGAEPAGAQPAPRFSWGADVRAGYFRMHRDERSGESTVTDDFRTRIRTQAGMRLGAGFDVGVRLAGRFSSAQESASFYVRDHAPATDGLLLGEATLDEAYIRYRPSTAWTVRVGRMQTKFTLADLQGKSLDRGDSPNTDITWTDGAHLTYGAGAGWRAHLVLQHNAREGATNVLRPPLDFQHPDSRLTVFAALESARPAARLVQRGLDVTYIPRALAVNGTGSDVRDYYIAVVGRATLAWPLGESGGNFSVGGEAGYAVNTPTLVALRLAEPGGAAADEAGGLALQFAVTLADVLPAHRFGLAYGYTEAGWLISPDFRNNDRLVEARYQWAFTRSHSFEARLRQRQELLQLTNAARRRSDLDGYIRVSLRF
jgi:hypothetical protein